MKLNHWKLKDKDLYSETSYTEEKAKKNYYPNIELVGIVEDRCGCGTGWNPFEPCPNKIPCERHKCWCGEQANRLCPSASSLVCGTPICEKHECRGLGH